VYGRGLGLGRGRRFFAPGAPVAPAWAAPWGSPWGAPEPADETAYLRAEAEALRRELGAIEARLEALEKGHSEADEADGGDGDEE
jgi:hypothetical protein